MKKRGRPGLKPHIESLIASGFLEDRKKPRKEWTPRKALAFDIQQEIEKKGWSAPELSTLMGRISDYSKKNKDPDPEDKPWNMATLDLYPIPPEAIPEVLRIWALRMEGGESFTIREAKWVARLSAFILPISPYTRLQIAAYARKYALLESIYQLLKWPFDTTILDRILMGVKGPETVDLKGFEPYIPLIATLGDGEERLEDFIKILRGGTSYENS